MKREQINTAIGGFRNVVGRCPRTKRTAINNARLIKVQKLEHHGGHFALGFIKRFGQGVGSPSGKRVAAAALGSKANGSGDISRLL